MLEFKIPQLKPLVRVKQVEVLMLLQISSKLAERSRQSATRSVELLEKIQTPRLNKIFMHPDH